MARLHDRLAQTEQKHSEELAERGGKILAREEDMTRGKVNKEVPAARLRDAEDEDEAAAARKALRQLGRERAAVDERKKSLESESTHRASASLDEQAH